MNKLRAIFVDIKKGRRKAESLFKLRDSKKRSIVHLASLYGHHLVLLHLACLIKMIKHEDENFDIEPIFNS